MYCNGATQEELYRTRKKNHRQGMRPLRDSRLSSSGYQPNLHGQPTMGQALDLSSKAEATAYALRIAAPRRNCTARSILTGHCLLTQSLQFYDGLIYARTNIQPLAQPIETFGSHSVSKINEIK